MDAKIDKIIRTKRKTVVLQITEDAELIIKAPLKMKEKDILKMIAKHRNLVKKKMKIAQERKRNFSPKKFVNGEYFLYIGKRYELQIMDNQEIPLKFEEDRFYLSKNALPWAREEFILWYKRKAYGKISERVERYRQTRNFKYNKINITNASKRWGSCSYNGNLSFTWRLIMAPLPVIDYVVIHELVHLEEKNHARTFWDKVRMLMPNYEKYKDWLKENGYLLKI